MHDRNGNATDPPNARATNAAAPGGFVAPTPPGELTDSTQRLIRQLEKLIAKTTQPDMRVSLLRRLALIFEDRCRDAAGAVQLLSEALSLRPRDRKTLAELQRLAHEAEPGSALGEVWETAAARVDDPGARAQLLLHRAESLRKSGSPAASILPYYEEVLSLQPDQPVATAAVAEAYREAGRWQDLAELLARRAASVTQDIPRVDLLFELGEIAELRLDQPDDALAAYESARSIAGDDPRTIESLVRLYRLSERWPELADTLEHMATLDPAHQARLRHEAGLVCEERLGDDERAIALYETLLGAEPGHRRALTRLRVLYTRGEDWTGLSGVLERQLEHAEDDAARADLYLRLAMLSEEAFLDAERAATFYRLLLGMDPTDTQAYEGLRRIYRGGEKWSELTSTLSARAEAVDAPEERRELLIRVARLRRRRLDDPEGAIAVLETLLAERPDDAEIHTMLEDLLRAAGSQKRLIEILEAKAAALDEPMERAVVYLELGEALKDTGQTAEARRAYRAALSDAPQMVTATRRLSSALAEEGRHDEVAEVLRDALDQVENNEVRATLGYDLAQAHRARGDDDAAIQTLLEALAAVPGHLEATEALANIYADAGRWQEARPLYESLLPHLNPESDPEAASHVLRRTAQAFLALGERDRAVSFCELADKVWPGQVETVRLLAELLTDLGRHEEAAEKHGELLGLTGADAASPEGLASRLALIAHERRQGDADAALDWIHEVLAAHPDQADALELWAAIADERGDTPAAIEAQRRLLRVREEEQRDVPALLDLRLALGERYVVVEDTEAAIGLLEDTIAKLVKENEPRRRLVGLYRDAGRPGAAFAMLMDLVRRASDSEECARYHYEAAQLCDGPLDRPQDAIEHYVLTAIHDIRRFDALQAAEERLVAREDWDGLAEALVRMVIAARTRGDNHLARNLLRRLGEHHLRRTGDLNKAGAAYREACALDPDDPELLRRLVEVLESAGQHDEAIAELRKLVALQPDRAEFWRALAQLFDRANQTDGRYSALSVLSVIGEATVEEEELLRRTSLPRLAAAQAALPKQAWKQLVQADGAAEPMAEVLRRIYHSVGAPLEVSSLREQGLSKGKELDPRQDLLLLRTMNETARLLDVSPPKVYFDEKGHGLRVLPIFPPAFAVGPGLLKGRRQEELAFLIAKGIALVQPEYALAALYNPDQLHLVFRAVRGYALPRRYTAPVDGTKRRQMEGLVRTFQRKVPRNQVEALREAVDACNSVEIERWLSAVARTSNRVGLLCSGDVTASWRLCARPITAQPAPVDNQTAALDLALFSVSSRFLELRRRLWGDASLSDTGRA